eukprot:scaffold3971_cov417-Prasinococcus_capsulatus_cf.AAC.2
MIHTSPEIHRERCRSQACRSLSAASLHLAPRTCIRLDTPYRPLEKLRRTPSGLKFKRAPLAALSARAWT